MFSFSAAGGDMMRIGARNVEEVKRQLERLHIPIVAEDVGAIAAAQSSLTRRRACWPSARRART